ncbi:hypothetical protein RG959_00965 [Domibacillus sp. 8LH]|uniref:hypothetical protein n=1 Tax=Domibacillus sp. 8LH TaxID=3073900 RepID=UPI00317432E9
MSREPPQAQPRELPHCLRMREIRPASLIGSILKAKDFVYTLRPISELYRPFFIKYCFETKKTMPGIEAWFFSLMKKRLLDVHLQKPFADRPVQADHPTGGDNCAEPIFSLRKKSKEQDGNRHTKKTGCRNSRQLKGVFLRVMILNENREEQSKIVDTLN